MPVKLAALPPQDAINYFAAKGYHLDPSFAWQDRVHEDHAAAFTVAKSAGFDILKDIHDAVLALMQDGTTFETVQKQLIPILQAKGWWGRQTVTDPLTGDPVSAQLGSVRRLKTIFDVNMRTAHAAGRWNQIQRTASSRPYLRYTAILDSKTRPMHRRWHGTVLQVGDPWWQTHFPPCGWFCRCGVQSYSEADLQRFGFNASPQAPNDGPPTRYVNPRTGAVNEVPAGIDPGWGYNPGQAAVDVHAARVAASKWVDAPPELTAAAAAASIRFMQPLLTKDFGNWVDQIEQGGYRATGDQRVVGALTQNVLDFLDDRGISPKSGAITVSDRTVLHIRRDQKQARGASVPMDDLLRLPDILAEPDAILFDRQDPALLYVFAPTDIPDKTGKILVRIDIGDRVARQTIISNAVRTGGIVDPSSLSIRMPDGSDRYVDVDDQPQSPGGTQPSP